MDLIWRSEEIIKFGDFCHFAPIAPNFLRAKIFPNKVFDGTGFIRLLSKVPFKHF